MQQSSTCMNAKSAQLMYVIISTSSESYFLQLSCCIMKLRCAHLNKSVSLVLFIQCLHCTSQNRNYRFICSLQHLDKIYFLMLNEDRPFIQILTLFRITVPTRHKTIIKICTLCTRSTDFIRYLIYDIKIKYVNPLIIPVYLYISPHEEHWSRGPPAQDQ